jgi:hypothetical protein
MMCVAVLFVAACGDNAPAPSTADSVEAAQRSIAGIPQHGNVLGRPAAPVTLRMFVSVGDLNRGFLQDDLPALVGRYVRSGRLKLSLEPVGGQGDVGEDRLNQLALATGLQNRLWSFYVTFGMLSDGSLSAAQQQRALGLVPSLDVGEARAAARSRRVRTLLRGADATPPGNLALPSFELVAPGVPPVPVRGDCAGCLMDRLAAALRRVGEGRKKAQERARAKAKARAKARAEARAKARARARTKAKPAATPAATSVPTIAPTAPPPAPVSPPPPASTPEPENTIFPPG